jgi:myo-inositol-1(or 4)-monophosphatase
MHKTDIVIGVVYEINRDECFYAVKDKGTYLNGKKVNVSEAKLLKDSLLVTGFPYHNYERLDKYLELFTYVLKNTHGLRRLGSAAVDLAYVACGRFETFFEYGLNPWDVAAGSLLVKEAGGKVSDFSGEENYIFGKEIIASNGFVFDEFLNITSKIFNNK